MTRVEARAELARLLEEGPDPFPLDRAALLLALDEYPDLELQPYEERLDDYAARVAAAVGPGETFHRWQSRLEGVREKQAGRLAGAGDSGVLQEVDAALQRLKAEVGRPDPRRRLAALRRVLFEDEGFHGNRDAYYDVRNSYLNEVLDRKLGIPISLAVVVLGVARRLGWPMALVNFPAHVLVRYEAPGEALAVDPFHGGLILDPDELVERWELTTGQPAPPIERMLQPAPPREALLRMLNNIRLIHHHGRQFKLAALAMEKIQLVDPANPYHERDLGAYLLAAGELHEAARRLKSYFNRVPHCADADEIRDHLARLYEDLPPER